MLARAESWALCKRHVQSMGVIPEEVWGTTLFFDVPLRDLLRPERRIQEWQFHILRDRFSEEGLNAFFKILEEAIPGVDHRAEYRHARETITPEQWANEMSCRKLDKVFTERCGS